MEIFITGDTHGDFCRFRPDIFYEQEHMSKEDLVLVCGDFGGIWYGDPRDDAGLDWLDSLPYTTAFVLGNHENYDAYKGYPKEEWHGGQIQRIRPSVLHLMRGQVYELNGRKFFTMGGASSHDIQDGILEPDDPDFEEKFQQLEQRGALFRVNHQSKSGACPLECGLHHQPLLPLQHTGCVQRRNVQERRTDRVLR